MPFSPAGRSSRSILLPATWRLNKTRARPRSLRAPLLGPRGLRDHRTREGFGCSSAIGTVQRLAFVDRVVDNVLVGAGPSSYSVAEAGDCGEWTSLSLSSTLLKDMYCVFTKVPPSYTACPVKSPADMKAASPTHAEQTGAGPVFDKADNVPSTAASRPASKDLQMIQTLRTLSNRQNVRENAEALGQRQSNGPR